MEWHNTTLLCYFRDFFVPHKSAKFIVYRIPEGGRVYRDFGGIFRRILGVLK